MMQNLQSHNTNFSAPMNHPIYTHINQSIYAQMQKHICLYSFGYNKHYFYCNKNGMIMSFSSATNELGNSRLIENNLPVLGLEDMLKRGSVVYDYVMVKPLIRMSELTNKEALSRTQKKNRLFLILMKRTSYPGRMLFKMMVIICIT